ncbi:MAG: protein kinase [Myxococcota bacterium]
MRDGSKAAVADPLVGRTFGGKYTIRRLIGRGGVGLVYLADDEEEGREVVLKLLAPDWIQNDEAVKRFEREAERLGSVRHPNVVRMFGSGHTDGRAFLVMEFLEGELLSRYVTEKKHLDVETFVPIAAQVLKGIGHAHSRGVILRDVKPANIMLCERKGRANFVKILDFGLAKLLKDEHPVTEEHVLGTAGYLAPEAIKGNDLDLSVDVFAVGVLFYYMLSGRLPFVGDDSATVFYKTIHDDPPPLAEVLPVDHAVPDGLMALIHRCLEKDPSKRPPDGNAVVEELIDVVPAAMFRLPKVATRSVMPPAAGFGNTGLVELVGAAALSGKHQAVPEPILEHIAEPGSGPVTVPAAVEAAPTGPITAQVDTKPGFGMMAGALLAGGLMAVLGGVAAAYIFLGDDDDASARASVTEPVAVSGSSDAAIDAESQLEAAQALVDEGKFDDATATLDKVRGVVAETPTLQGRLERIDKNLLIGRLMAAGDAFEGKGDIGAAVAAYRDVLEADATHVEARARLARLTARADGEDEESDLSYGAVEFGSKPLANLYIDGESLGTTPFKGKLPVGKHHVRMTARGYHAWEGDVEVAESDNDELKVRLSPKGRGTSKGKSKPTPAIEPKPEPQAAPKPATPKPKPAKKKKNVFLPTADDSGKNGGGVFLPTKD